MLPAGATKSSCTNIRVVPFLYTRSLELSQPESLSIHISQLHDLLFQKLTLKRNMLKGLNLKAKK